MKGVIHNNIFFDVIIGLICVALCVLIVLIFKYNQRYSRLFAIAQVQKQKNIEIAQRIDKVEAQTVTKNDLERLLDKIEEDKALNEQRGDFIAEKIDKLTEQQEKTHELLISFFQRHP